MRGVFHYHHGARRAANRRCHKSYDSQLAQLNKIPDRDAYGTNTFLFWRLFHKKMTPIFKPSSFSSSTQPRRMRGSGQPRGAFSGYYADKRRQARHRPWRQGVIFGFIPGASSPSSIILDPYPNDVPCRPFPNVASDSPSHPFPIQPQRRSRTWRSSSVDPCSSRSC